MLSLGSWKFTAPQTSLPAYELPPMATLYAAGAWPAVGQTDPAADAVVDAILAEIGLDHGALPQCLHANEKKRPSQSPLRPAASFRCAPRLLPPALPPCRRAPRRVRARALETHQHMLPLLGRAAG